MKVRRQLDGKVYAVQESHNGALLVRHPLDGGQFWLNSKYVDVVDDDTPVDVP